MLTYFGWLYFNLKTRLDSWWNKSDSEQSSSELDSMIQETEARYDYNKF